MKNATLTSFNYTVKPFPSVSFLCCGFVDLQGFFFEGVLCAAFSDNDQWVFTGSKDRTVKVWDVATGTLWEQNETSNKQYPGGDVSYL